MSELPLSISWIERLYNWCQNKTKAMLLMPEQNKNHAIIIGSLKNSLGLSKLSTARKSCYMDLSQLWCFEVRVLIPFMKHLLKDHVNNWILQNVNKWQRVLIESKHSMSWVRCAFGNVCACDHHHRWRLTKILNLCFQAPLCQLCPKGTFAEKWGSKFIFVSHRVIMQYEVTFVHIFKEQLCFKESC